MELVVSFGMRPSGILSIGNNLFYGKKCKYEG